MDQVHPGLHGVGRTIFQGDKISDFQVDVLGILKNALAPKHDAILVRLSGGPLEETGVIAGMSGSPVYIDGKLLGAVAIAFPFAKEPYGIVTPIQDMLDVVPEALKASAPAASLHWEMAAIPASGGERLIPDPDPWKALRDAFPQAAGPLADFRLPLRFGGFSTAAVAAYSPLFRSLGFEPIAGGGLAGAPSEHPEQNAAADAKAIVPGSMVSLLFVQGDLVLNADCTVTYRQADQLYACGHQIFLAGPTQIPFSKADVLATIPNLQSSFKIDAPGPPVGTIHQDRFGAIFGTVGEPAATIPVHIHLKSTLNRSTDYDFQVAQAPLLAPLLVNLGIVSAVGATERMIGPSTLQVQGVIELSNGEAVRLEDVVSGDAGAANGVGAVVATPLNYLMNSGFTDLHVGKIDLNVTAQNQAMTAALEQVWASQSEVRPGDHLDIMAVLRTPDGGSITQKIPVEIPESVRDKTITLMVGSGSNINAFQGRIAALTTPPRDLHQLVRALNRMRRNNRLYALLMTPQASFRLEGEEFPSPPPSLLRTFLSDPAATSRVQFAGTSVIGDYETQPIAYTIQGQQMLMLKVENGDGS